MSGTKLNQIDRSTVLAVIGLLAEPFCTKDVSEHPRMLAAHSHLQGERTYHAIVGKFLKRLENHQGLAVLVEVQKQTSRGSRWRRVSGAAVSALDSASDLAAHVEDCSISPQYSGDAEANGIGPQYSGDPSFTASMRLHQSWYRAQVLRVPYGTGPLAHSKNHYGNMLTREDGLRGLNFLTPEIFRVAKERLAKKTGLIDEFRLLHNMLSSQPMCLNLFGPMVADNKLATTLTRQLLPGEVDHVTRVIIEFAPEPRSEYLDDHTAFDAFIEYRQPDGALAFLGVETKLTEPFSRNTPDKPTYRRWMKGPGSPWRQDQGHLVAEIEHNQLWRDHLLAIATRDHASSRYVKGRLALVRHPGDVPCTDVVRGYRQLLREDDHTFVDLPLDHLIERLRLAELSPEQRKWLNAFERRYLDIDASKATTKGRGQP